MLSRLDHAPHFSGSKSSLYSLLSSFYQADMKTTGQPSKLQAYMATAKGGGGLPVFTLKGANYFLTLLCHGAL